MRPTRVFASLRPAPGWAEAVPGKRRFDYFVEIEAHFPHDRRVVFVVHAGRCAPDAAGWRDTPCLDTGAGPFDGVAKRREWESIDAWRPARRRGAPNIRGEPPPSLPDAAFERVLRLRRGWSLDVPPEIVNARGRTYTSNGVEIHETTHRGIDASWWRRDDRPTTPACVGMAATRAAAMRAATPVRLTFVRRGAR